MHKAYQSTKPCANKYLQQRWDDHDYQMHRRSLSSIKPSIDTTAPNTYMHMHLKPKKLQLEEERLAIIERDNRILLEKISNVMRTKGGVDNQNDYPFGSLNREKRQREMLRVTRENEQIIKRILNTEAEFNRDKLEKDWQDTLKNLDMISHYPKDWWLLRRSQTSMTSTGSKHSGVARSRTQADDDEKDNEKQQETHGATESNDAEKANEQDEAAEKQDS